MTPRHSVMRPTASRYRLHRSTQELRWEASSIRRSVHVNTDERDSSATITTENSSPMTIKFHRPKSNLKVKRLLSFLLDNLRFTYNISPRLFDDAMAEGPLDSHSKFMHSGSLRLLNDFERQCILAFGGKVGEACSKIKDNHYSLLTDNERAFLVDNIFEPARLLDIDPAYMLEQILAFKDHRWQDEQQKRTLLYANTTSIWSLGGVRFSGKASSQRLLARRLVSDEIVVGNLGERIGEPLRLLIAKAIAQFDQEHCKIGMGNVHRNVYAGPVPTALAEELWSWQVKIPRELHGSPAVAHVRGGDYQQRRPETAFSARPTSIRNMPRRSHSAAGNVVTGLHRSPSLHYPESSFLRRTIPNIPKDSRLD